MGFVLIVRICNNYFCFGHTVLEVWKQLSLAFSGLVYKIIFLLLLVYSATVKTRLEHVSAAASLREFKIIVILFILTFLFVS